MPRQAGLVAGLTRNGSAQQEQVGDGVRLSTDGDPTAGGSVYLTNDEVGVGNVQCGTTTANNVLVMYRSPAAAAAGTTGGLAFGPTELALATSTDAASVLDDFGTIFVAGYWVARCWSGAFLP